MHQPDHFLHGIQRLALRATLRDTNCIENWRDWFPITLDDHSLIWRHIAQRFTTPFFADLLSQQAPDQRQVCRTLLHHLPPLPAVPPPTAFIFHTSRCGSTLLTQMLATLPQCIAISEAPIIDVCLRSPPSMLDASARLALLRHVIQALGQRRHAESHCIIKLDCWHLPYLPVLRAAFPATPCWFLYREPQAVLASHQRQRGPQMLPGIIFPQQLPGATAPLAAGDLDGYAIQVLALLFQSALDQHSANPANLHLLNYQQLPQAVWQQFLPELGVHPDPAQLAALQLRAGFHAKQQGTPFAGDARTSLSAASLHLLQTQVLPQYQKLEQLRRAASNALL